MTYSSYGIVLIRNLEKMLHLKATLLNLNLNFTRNLTTFTSSSVENQGVILDSNLSFENHISNVTKTAFYHLRNIAKLRNMLSVSDAEQLVHAFMTSRLDYCNALLGGCPAYSINKLQIMLWLESLTGKENIIILQKILIDYKALNGLAPEYLTNLLSRYNPTRTTLDSW